MLCCVTVDISICWHEAVKGRLSTSSQKGKEYLHGLSSNPLYDRARMGLILVNRGCAFTSSDCSYMPWSTRPGNQSKLVFGALCSSQGASIQLVSVLGHDGMCRKPMFSQALRLASTVLSWEKQFNRELLFNA